MVRGEVVRVAAPRRARGHEQRGARPGVVVQADELLDLSTVLIASTRALDPTFGRQAYIVAYSRLIAAAAATAVESPA
jgi:mRNA interferase MazF